MADVHLVVGVAVLVLSMLLLVLYGGLIELFARRNLASRSRYGSRTSL